MAAKNLFDMNVQLSDLFQILKKTFTKFMADKGLKFSASLAYYTALSIGPLLLLLIAVAGLIYGQDAVEGKLFSEINGLIGETAAHQIQDILKNMALSGKSVWALIIGGITLLIGATTIFGEIQDSINTIWQVKAKPKKGWLKMLKDRLKASSLIVTLGFLLVASLLVNGILMTFGDFLSQFFSIGTLRLVNVFNVAINFIVIAFLFGVIFKILPDVKIQWKDVRSGAFFTAILFMIGRFAIGFYIQTSGTASAYGAAGSIIVILLWVYYTAAILYLGAEFTQVNATFKGRHIEPADYAVHIEQREVPKP